MTCQAHKNPIAVLCLLALVFSYNGAIAHENSELVLNLKVRPNKIEGEPASASFKNQLLKLILEKTKEEYGEFVISEYPSRIKQSRVISFIKQNETFRVIATMDSLKRRKEIRPIEIPIYKGLLSHRIFIIREEDQPIFSKIKTIDQLQTLSAIQGHDWPDSDILQRAGFSVQRSPNYTGIFKMLRLNRGDYFPRGVHEPWLEVQKHKDKKLSVEKDLLIQYNAPFYFFVNYDDKGLYSRIKTGFLMAIQDGSFSHLFYNHPEILLIFKKAKISSRRIFRIENPEFVKNTSQNKQYYWYKMGDEERYRLKKKFGVNE